MNLNMADLNDRNVRRVIAQDILPNSHPESDIYYLDSDVKFSHKRCMLIICGVDVLCWDRHYHYEDSIDHPLAVFEFLSSVKNLFKERRDILKKIMRAKSEK